MLDSLKPGPRQPPKTEQVGVKTKGRGRLTLKVREQALRDDLSQECTASRE
jgi:hypothetical protein